MVTVKASISDQLYKTTITNGRHILIADEPVSAGGGDLGFSPDELLAASLSACTSATLRMYANRKGWHELLTIEVGVIFNRLKDTSSMTRTITLTGNVSEEQKERLLYIANRCPIHQTLTHLISIDTSVTRI